MDEAAARVLVRITARTSLLLFLAAFTGTALKALWPARWTAWLAEHRAAFLRGLAVSHLAHFAGIVVLDSITHGQALRNQPPAALAGGALAYALILAMAVWPLRARLNTVGMYWVWIILLVSYVGSTFTVSLLYLPAALLVVGGLVVRILVRRQVKASGL